jgi:hypothetical protein
MKWIQCFNAGPVIIIPQAAPNFFTPNGTLESIDLGHPRRDARELHDLHWSVNKLAVKIGLDSFIEKRSCSQSRPPFRVVPMIVSNNCSSMPSVVNVLEDVSTHALVNRHAAGLS